MPSPAEAVDVTDPVRQPGGEPLPGYRLIEPLGKGGFGEVWKCEAAGGLLKAIKFIEGRAHTCEEDAPAEEEQRAIERVKRIRHPFILSLERVEAVAGGLIVVSELADKTLADVLREQRGPGIPRLDLLAYLAEAAEALDVMRFQHGLQHLDVKPQNLFVVAGHVKVGDFGLVRRLPQDGAPGRGPENITPLYASPEVLGGSFGPNSDQYSLAIVYQELLTGTLPFSGKNGRQLMLNHLTQEPDLSAVPEADRPVLARALAKSPSQRFPNCTELIRALAALREEGAPAPGSPQGDGRPLSLTLTGPLTGRTRPVPRVTRTLQFRFGAALPPRMVRERLEAFRKEWHAEAVSGDGLGLELQLEAPTSPWRYWPGVRQILRVGLSSAPSAEGAEVRMEIRPADGMEGGEDLYAVVGPLLAESLRTHLQTHASRRAQVRLNWLHPLRLSPVLPDGSHGPDVECQGKDISLDGLGFYVQGTPPAGEVVLHLPATPFTEERAVAARVVRVKHCGGGWHEVGVAHGPARPVAAPLATPGTRPEPAAVPPPARGWPAGALAVAATVLIGFGLGVVRWPPARAESGHPAPETPAALVAGVEYPDLDSAIAAAPDGAAVEIRGTVRAHRVRIAGKSLALRGVAGTRPTIARLADRESVWEPLVWSDRALVIDGVRLRGTREDIGPLACVEGAELSLLGCEIDMPAEGPAVSVRKGTALLLDRCTLEAGGQALSVEVAGPCRVSVQGCKAGVRAANGAFLSAWADKAVTPAPVHVEMRGSEIRAGRALACRGIAGPVTVGVAGNTLAIRGPLVSWAGYPAADGRPEVTWQTLGEPAPAE